MTTAIMLDWFNILQDKFGSPYFTSTEQLLFLNRAQVEYIDNLFPDEEDKTIKITSHLAKKLSSLVYELNTEDYPAIFMNSSGVINNSDVTASLITESGDAGAIVRKILSLEGEISGDRFPIKWLRDNDKGPTQRNYFKKPQQSTPKYTYRSDGLQVYPTNENLELFITVLKTPKDLNTSPTVNSELPDDTHNRIIAIGLEFAGVASRDEALMALQSLQK